MATLEARIASFIAALGPDIKKMVTNVNGGAEVVGSALATSGVVTANLNNGNIFPISPSASVSSLALANPSATGTGCSVRIIATNGSTAYLIPLPTGGAWLGAIPVPTANKKTVYDYFTIDAGTTWYCSAVNTV